MNQSVCVVGTQHWERWTYSVVSAGSAILVSWRRGLRPDGFELICIAVGNVGVAEKDHVLVVGLIGGAGKVEGSGRHDLVVNDEDLLGMLWR